VRGCVCVGACVRAVCVFVSVCLSVCLSVGLVCICVCLSVLVSLCMCTLLYELVWVCERPCVCARVFAHYLTGSVPAVPMVVTAETIEGRNIAISTVYARGC